MGTVGSRQHYSNKRHFPASVELLFKTEVNLFSTQVLHYLDILAVEQKYI